MKKSTIFTAICVVAMALTAFSCKTKEPANPDGLAGTWNTMNQDKINVEAGALTGIINEAIASLGVKLPPKVTFNEDGTGSFTADNGTANAFTYTKTDNLVTIKATSLQFGPIDVSNVPISFEYKINSNKELRLYLDATQLVKMFLGTQSTEIAAMAALITKAEMEAWYKK